MISITTAPPPEILLAKAYDDLVDSRDTVLSFKQESFLVAEFTRLYIQNLFHLSEAAFRSIIRKNVDLNAKATSYECRGKNPVDLLRRQILKRDDFGRILERYSTHLGALDCILDVRATAALVHHMICLQPSDDLPLGVLGCEFGSGTGILSVAGSIPFVHRGKDLTVHSFEQSPESREDAGKIVEVLQRESRYKDQLHFHIHPADVTTGKPYKAVKEAEQLSGPLALWISETFGHRSKKPVVSEGAVTCTYSNPSGAVPYPPDLEKKYDPLVQVLDHSCHYFDAFLQKIRTGYIVAFPDIVTPRVIIDGEMSTILSPDGTWRKLHEIGRPYDMLPPCAPTRWGFEEQPTPPQKRGFRKYPGKKRKKRR